MSEEHYRCPRTGRPLVRRDDALETHDGGMRYPITRGIPDFRLVAPADPNDERALAELAALAAADGWRPALAKLRPELLADVDDPSHAMFLDLLPLTPSLTALEIGAGLGQVLVALAPRVWALHALELSPGQAQFAAIRCRQQGCDNVFVATGGDDLLLPYADRSFGAVVLKHGFESARIAGEDEVTLAGQQQLLCEIRRVLAPDGLLFLGMKNRFGLQLLLGGRDEDARNLRFGNALPRPITAALAARRPGTLGLLHSHWRLSRLLQRSGFEPLQSFWETSDGRYPTSYVATDSESVRRARRAPEFVQGATRGTRLLMPLVPAALVKFFTPGLAFVARSTA